MSYITRLHPDAYLDNLYEDNLSSNITDNGTYPKWVGFVSAGVSVVLYGSNFVPLKKVETGDGVFVQFLVCLGIWTIGLAVNVWRQSPQFHPAVMLGGLLWTTGNMCVVPIIQTVGIGLGLLVWGLMNMLFGWASGRFGWFDIPPQIPKNPTLNYIGVGVASISCFLFVFLKPETINDNVEIVEQSTNNQSENVTSDQNQGVVYDDEVVSTRESSNYLYPSLQDNAILINSRSTSTSSKQRSLSNQTEVPIWMRMNPTQKRIIGFTLSLISGVFYGLSFVPTYYVQHHPDTNTKNGLDYVFSQFTGIFASSTLYFVLYCIIKKNKPWVNSQAALTSYISGALWGVAGTTWFVANQVLSEAVSFPIITTGPAVVAALWSVIVFRELKGMKNMLVLLLAFGITATGNILCGLSNI